MDRRRRVSVGLSQQHLGFDPYFGIHYLLLVFGC